MYREQTKLRLTLAIWGIHISSNHRIAKVKRIHSHGNTSTWFVDEVKYVNNANEEIEGVGKVNLRHVAVADAKFKEQLAQSVKQDDTSVVKMIAV